MNRKAFKQKKCCAHGVGLGPCEGGVIKAHTISCGPNLTKIAENGHVIQYRADIVDLKKNGRSLSAKKIGIKDASTFYGFCSKHDRELFSCIENEAFSGRQDQCLAVAYRTLSRELYGKDALAHLRETLRNADKGMQLFEQLAVQQILDEINLGNEAARRDLQATFDLLTVSLVENRRDAISSLVLELSAPLPFMFAGAWSPFTDLYGNEIQKGYADERLKQIFFSSFSGTSNTMVCISWLDIDSSAGKVIADQIKALSADTQASACLQMVAKHAENIFFNPNWFFRLASKQRDQLNKLTASGIDLMGSVPSAPVCLDTTFDLPSVVRSFEV
ncbi:hypothetical protein TH19_11455 [Thalassospira profundimaris]|uniref:Uncharacterized protein n=2 Tax=Thalassospira TaxID=168934 RepID=A0A367W6U9_9PROT|nr:hypothetical protein TH19_11455 [Thalassospira profundimaris]